MPSFIAALRAGLVIGSGRPKTDDEILAIEQDHQKFIDSYYETKPPTWINEYGLEVRRVPQTKFWFVDDKTFIGEISIRHELNDYLLNRGGNIGYGVRPDMTNQGYATLILRLALDFCRGALGLDKVLITADETNIASLKVIEKNGGMMEDIRVDGSTSRPFRRFWITL